MNELVAKLASKSGFDVGIHEGLILGNFSDMYKLEKFAGLVVGECINREELLGAIARGWCHEKNSHKTMDSDLALAIFDEVEQQIRKHFGVEE